MHRYKYLNICLCKYRPMTNILMYVYSEEKILDFNDLYLQRTHTIVIIEENKEEYICMHIL